MNGDVYNPRYIFWSRIVSTLIWPIYFLFNLFRQAHKINHEDIGSILVCQYQRIGDILLIVPVLESLKKRFPKAKITLLCCSAGEPLARDLELADKVIGIDVPWTTWSFSPLRWFCARSFARTFQNQNIDLAIDFKGDLRNSWFLWHVKPKMSLGYTDTGGSFFFSDPKNPSFGVHQTNRSLELISHLGCEIEKRGQGDSVFNDDGFIVIHIGGTDPRRLWPEEKWVELINLLSRDHHIAFVKILETGSVIQRINDKKINIEIFEGDLVQFKHWLKNQKMLIGIDSMPVHLAAYVGIPVLTLFGSQNPNLTHPLGRWTEIVSPELPCHHKRNHWRLCSKCMDAIAPEKVSLAVKNLLSRVKKTH